TVQAERHTGYHEVDTAGAIGLDHLVTDIVDNIGIVTVAAHQQIRAGAAIQIILAIIAVERVGAAVADNGIVEGIAIDGERGGTGQRDVLDLLATPGTILQVDRDRGDHLVSA